MLKKLYKTHPAMRNTTLLTEVSGLSGSETVIEVTSGIENALQREGIKLTLDSGGDYAIVEQGTRKYSVQKLIDAQGMYLNFEEMAPLITYRIMVDDLTQEQVEVLRGYLTEQGKEMRVRES